MIRDVLFFHEKPNLHIYEKHFDCHKREPVFGALDLLLTNKYKIYWSSQVVAVIALHSTSSADRDKVFFFLVLLEMSEDYR